MKLLETPESKVDPTETCPQHFQCWYSFFASLKVPNMFLFSRRKQAFGFYGRLPEEKQLISGNFIQFLRTFYELNLWQTLADVLEDILTKVVFIFEPFQWVLIKPVFQKSNFWWFWAMSKFQKIYWRRSTLIDVNLLTVIQRFLQ